ncbi:hypothetical protein QBC34DRAFT_466705 [Podospora aff. communis PSN243]|uniref:F-box domain-containing protein n=1 Tax=Podospora aff. communis PSN243 TaxID=3040156 RepID=A0AAV9GGU8_9PEZI|nr:hypothetical protein QBC34DRAFT_466705 [Podospora aff. communis PSN243]
MASIFGPAPPMPVNTLVIRKLANVDYLTKLPPEILQMICKHLIARWNTRTRRSLLSVAATCRVLRNMTLPMLFSDITNDRFREIKIIPLLKALQSNPQLHPLIKKIDIQNTSIRGKFSKEDAEFLWKTSKEIIGLKHEQLVVPGRARYAWFDSTIHGLALLLSLAPNAATVSMSAFLGEPRNVLNSRHKAQNRRKPKLYFPGVTEIKFILSRRLTFGARASGDLWGVTELLTALPKLDKLELVDGLGWTFKNPLNFKTPSITSLILTECDISSDVLEKFMINFHNLIEFRFTRHSTPILYPDDRPAPKFILQLTRPSAATLEKLSISCIPFLRPPGSAGIPHSWPENGLIREISGYRKLQHLSLGAKCVPGIDRKSLVEVLEDCSSLTSLELTGVGDLNKEYLDSVARDLQTDGNFPIRTVTFERKSA